MDSGLSENPSQVAFHLVRLSEKIRQLLCISRLTIFPEYRLN